ncbi:MAG: 4-(cytidine 5'-diphospho)-2-C-methyl-D-erythritol kinase [Leptospira sp.]|nr:4-(cytidine 5'-diphospho)-2-C-methyl-D-erythritol kinase [Leptospira sp.]
MELSSGKINLGLSIPFKRPDGYHEIQTIFVPISFGDRIEFRFKSAEGGQSSFQLSSKNFLKGYRSRLFEDVSERGDVSKNILYRAYERLLPYFRTPTRIEIDLEKYLPPEGGIGGGSSNAGSFLRSALPYTNLNPKELFEMGRSLGADVPFFLQEKPSVGTGIGEILEPISLAKGKGILAIPDFGLSTSSMYAGLQKSLQKTHDSKVWKTLTEDVLRSLEEGLWEGVAGKLVNDFEPLAIQTKPILKELKDGFLRSGSGFVSMSGSGSCFYGLYPTDADTTKVRSSLEFQFPDMEFQTFSF